MLTYLLIIITLYLAGNAYIFIRAKQALKVKSLGVKIFLTVLFIKTGISRLRVSIVPKKDKAHIQNKTVRNIFTPRDFCLIS